MNFLKIGLLLSALALFIVACTQANNPGGGNNATSAANTANNRSAAANTTNAGGGSGGTGNQTSGKQTGAQPSAGQSAELAAAGETYKTVCAKCHQESGEGGEVAVNGKKLRVPNFKTERMKNDADEDFIDAIANGIPEDGMPAFKDRLSEERIRNLVQYIRSEIQGK